MLIKKIFITGGAGFIGSHICEEVYKKFPKSKIIIFDKLTYAGNKKYLENIITSSRVKFVRGDIIKHYTYSALLKSVDLAINIAAESHVDNSFISPHSFSLTNTVGAHAFLLQCIENKVKKIIHISSDEIYGEKLLGKCTERQKIEPTNPYSASKAAAEIFINSYKYSYKKEIITVRGNNIYGIRQYPEKLIPRCIISLLKNRKIPIHGNGKNQRFYLSAQDFSSAIILLIKKKNNGIYNIGSNESYSNVNLAKLICKYLNKDPKKFIKHVKDRPYNDKRYSISSSKIRKIGWRPKFKLNKDLPKIIQWYSDNLYLYKGFKK
jgi:dTDP-glucose 4,6-dehydratase